MARGLIVLAVLVAACAEPAPPTLATGSAEAALPAAIWPDDPSLVSDVVCPDLDVELIAQSTTCTATLDLDPVTVDVEVDELGAATATVREPLFVVSEAADELLIRLRDDLSIDALGVTCTGVVVVPSAGRTVDCQATNGDRTISFELLLVDRDVWTLELAD